MRRLLIVQLKIGGSSVVKWPVQHSIPSCIKCGIIFRWFKFTLKPPIVVAIGNLQLAIWDTSFWNNFVKFGHRTP